LARAGGEVLAIPLDAVVRTISCPPDTVELIQDREVIAVRGRQVPLIRVAHVLELGQSYDHRADLQVVLTRHGGELYGLACEHLLGKKEIVIKPLGDLLENVPCAAGATLLGDRCALILDVPALIRRAHHRPDQRSSDGERLSRSRDRAETASHTAAHVLVVEDSEMMRESLRRLLLEAGYRCTVANDGVDGLSAASARRYDLVSTDVMMPRMDGYELTRALRAMPEYRDTPIVMVTSRGERIDRVRGFDAGVDEYITKPHDSQLYLRAVRKLLAARPVLSESAADGSSGPAPSGEAGEVEP
ncbi:MAG: response regulator, partial [Myxococcota bacterium]